MKYKIKFSFPIFWKANCQFCTKEDDINKLDTIKCSKMDEYLQNGIQEPFCNEIKLKRW